MNELYVTVVVSNNAISLYCGASDTDSEIEDAALETEETDAAETNREDDFEGEYPPTDPNSRPGSVSVINSKGDVEITENLADTDPALLNKILRTLKTATESQCIVDYSHPPNYYCKINMDEWNKNNPNDLVDVDDIVRSVGIEDYAGSVWSTDSNRLGEFLHVFKNVDIGAFTQGHDKLKLYIKFATPVGGEAFDVVSFHRNKEMEQRLARKVDPTVPPIKRNRSKKKKNNNAK